MAGEDYNKLFAQAAEIASNVPEAMQDAAFRRALDLLLDGDGGGEEKPEVGNRPKGKAKRKPASRTKQSDSDDRAATLVAELNRTSYPQISDASNVKDRALWLLRFANDDFSIDGLSAPEIAKVLTEKFRLNCTRQAVTQALDKASRLVDRDTRAASVRYRIMDPGEKYLDNPESEEEDGEAKTQAKRPKAKKARPAKANRSKAAKGGSGKSAKPKKGRPTPFTVLEGLVATGFFKTPQTISMIREHMEQKQGRKYKANELSPALLRLLRNEKLTRAKNDDKQYEYSSN